MNAFNPPDGAPSGGHSDLLTESEFCDYCTVTLNILLLEIVEKAAALTDHLKKTTAAVIILVVYLEVLGELGDALRKNRNLYFRRTCVCVVEAVIRDNLCLFLFENHVFHLSLSFPLSKYPAGELPVLTGVFPGNCGEGFFKLLYYMPKLRHISMLKHSTTQISNCKELFSKIIFPRYFLFIKIIFQKLFTFQYKYATIYNIL